MKYDMIIIGAGPAGYVAAIRAAQTGMRTALIEKDRIGGMCLNWGCIPTKAYIESARFFEKLRQAESFGIEGVDPSQLRFSWPKVKERAAAVTGRLKGGIQYLLRKNGVEVIAGEARLHADGTVSVDNRNLEAAHIIIATGSRPAALEAELQHAPHVELHLLQEMNHIPGHVVIRGKGIHSAEIAQFFRKAGSHVTLVMPDDNLLPRIDDLLKTFVFRKLKSEQIRLITDPVMRYADGFAEAGGEKIRCDLIVNSGMRQAVIPEHGGLLRTDEKGFIFVDENFRTSMENVYAIGDVSGRSYLAHPASAQGLFVVNHLHGIRESYRPELYPLNMYTDPEIAQIGMTEKQLQEEGTDYKVNEFPLSANGKAQIEGNTEGFIRLLSEKKYGQVLGVQIVAAHATDMIAEAAAIMQVEGTVYDLARICHAHPTLSEVFMEAGLDAVDKAIHK